MPAPQEPTTTNLETFPTIVPSETGSYVFLLLMNSLQLKLMRLHYSQVNNTNQHRYQQYYHLRFHEQLWFSDRLDIQYNIEI